MSRPNAAYYLWRFVGNGRRTLRAAMTKPTFSEVEFVAHRLTKDGIVVGRSDQFLSAPGHQALSVASQHIVATSQSQEVQAQVRDGGGNQKKNRKKFLVHLVSYPHGIPSDEPLLTVALDVKLLEIVSKYLGMWPSLYSIGAWLNYPTDAPPELSQVWHRDPEDLKLVKAFIYLSDVNDTSGPFTYIPKTHPFGVRNEKARHLERKGRRIDDAQMTFPPEAWKVCTGPANTMILADTVGYHRGGKPTVGQRTLVTFTYTSGTPIDDSGLWLCDRPAWLSTPIQRAATAWLLDSGRRRARRRSHH